MAGLTVRTRRPQQVVDLTDRLEELVRQAGLEHGVCHAFVTHTTACLTTGEVGEGTDADLLEVVREFVPGIEFRHAHDPSHAWSHMAASIVGASLSVPVRGGRLSLGTWQSVLLLELDGPRERTVEVTLLESA